MEKLGKICMLDDDISVLNLFEDWLSSRGYEILATPNVYKFLSYAKEMRPDVFVLDLNMPEISGWEVLKLLKSDEALKNIPVLMITVSRDKDLVGHNGVAHYIHKPTSLEKVMEIIEAYCIGRKEHDVLLVDRYEPVNNLVLLALVRQHLSVFEVHDLNAAKVYLDKNFPRCVCITIPYEESQEDKIQLNHNRIFYVENPENLENLAALL